MKLLLRHTRLHRYLNILTIYYYTFLGYRIGFESITYTVDEGIGSFMVCVQMFEPSPETVIGLTFNLAVETFLETAGE